MIPQHSRILEYIAPGELLAYPLNSKRHGEAQVSAIAGSISEFGFTRPVLIDEHNVILAGHGATQAALLLGMEEVECRRIYGLTPARKRAYIIADNKLAERGEWDNDTLRAEIESLREEDFDLSLTGFNFDEIEKLLREIEPEETVDFSADSDGSTSGNPTPTLKFDKYKIEMTEAESEDLAARVEAHVAKYGSFHGFVARLLMAAASQASQHREEMP